LNLTTGEIILHEIELQTEKIHVTDFVFCTGEQGPGMEIALAILFAFLSIFHVFGLFLNIVVSGNPKNAEGLIGASMLNAMAVVSLCSITSHVLVILTLLSNESDGIYMDVIFKLDAFDIFWHGGIFAHLQYSTYSKCLKGLMRLLHERITKLTFIRLFLISVATYGSFLLQTLFTEFYLPIFSALLTVVASGIHIVLVTIIRNRIKSLYVRFASPSLEPMVIIQSLKHDDDMSVKSRGSTRVSLNREKNKMNYLRLISRLQDVIKISLIVCVFLVIVLVPLVAVRSDGSFISGVIISIPWKIAYVIPCIYIPYEEYISQHKFLV